MLPNHELMSGSFPRRFLRGAGYIPRGIGTVLRRPAFYPFLVMPALIVGLTMMTSLWVSFLVAQQVIRSLEADMGTSLLIYLVGLAVFISSVGLSYLCSGLVAIPFTDRLSVEVERLTGLNLDEAFSWSVFMRDLARSLVHSAISLMLYIVIVVLLLPLHLVPGVGSVVHAGLSLLVTAAFASREIMDGAMSRRRMSYWHKWRTVRANASVLLGMGLTAGLLVAIPLLGFFIMPLAVAGGTLMFNKLEADGLVPAS